MTWRKARTAEQRAELLAAAEESGNKSRAAEALGVSRQHLHRLLKGESASAPPAGCVNVTVSLERELVEWLDFEAVRLKHRTGAGKASKGEVIAELIRQAMEKRP
jgi:hypothetical protein